MTYDFENDIKKSMVGRHLNTFFYWVSSPSRFGNAGLDYNQKETGAGVAIYFHSLQISTPQSLYDVK